MRNRAQLPELELNPSPLITFTQAHFSCPPLAHQRHSEHVLTQADGRFACPAAIGFASAVFRASLEGEALLAGIDESVAHGGQVQSPDVGMGWCLWLPAVMSWRKGKKLLDLGYHGLSATIPCSQTNFLFLWVPCKYNTLSPAL